MELLLNFGLDWLNILLRWTHLIVGIAWIGASFYFVWLDDHLEPPKDNSLKEKGVSGELWAVHGGGFYNPQKYLIAPKNLPKNLHWFYWESYSTFLSGIALFIVIYLFNPTNFLIDPNIAAISPAVAIIAAVGFLIVGWLVYDLICRLLNNGKPKSEAIMAILIIAFIIVATVAAAHLFSGRAAFLIIGAMMGTIMTANVFFWIIPGQRRVVEAMRTNQPINPKDGQIAKQRSVHNTYFTLPVLFAMLSNHFTVMTNHGYNYLLLILMMVAGAMVRRYFVERHTGKGNWLWIAIAVASVFVVMVWTLPKNFHQSISSEKPVTLATDIRPILVKRCNDCHTGPAAPKQMDFTSDDVIRQNAMMINQQVVIQKSMPQNNITEMTEEERALFAKWFTTGAK